MASATSTTNGTGVKEGYFLLSATPIIGSQIELDKLKNSLNSIPDFEVTAAKHVGKVDWPFWQDRAEVWFNYSGNKDETELENLIFDQLNNLNILNLNIKDLSFGVSEGESGVNGNGGGAWYTHPVAIFGGGALTFVTLDQIFD